MNKLSWERRSQILASLVEGNSIRSTCRMTGAAKGTVLKLLVDAGNAAQRYHDETVRNLTSQRLQCDEIWSFCHAEERHIPVEHEGEYGYGDMWTWTCIDADTKLAVSWLVGDRSPETAQVFMQDVADRLKNRVQLTTDGHKAYLTAVEDAFGRGIDFAQLVKTYGPSDPESQRRYSPTEFVGTEVRVIQGDPDQKHISTSFVERQNLTMRMQMRQFTRLANAFSKKAENLAHAVALHFLWDNFARPHKTLGGRTPAMAAGLTDHAWDLMKLAAMVEIYGEESVKSSSTN